MLILFNYHIIASYPPMELGATPTLMPKSFHRCACMLFRGQKNQNYFRSSELEWPTGTARQKSKQNSRPPPIGHFLLRHLIGQAVCAEARKDKVPERFNLCSQGVDRPHNQVTTDNLLLFTFWSVSIRQRDEQIWFHPFHYVNEISGGNLEPIAIGPHRDSLGFVVPSLSCRNLLISKIKLHSTSIRGCRFRPSHWLGHYIIRDKDSSPFHI